MRTQSRPMPFTKEQMKQVFDANLIDFAVRNGFEIEKGDTNTVHVKHSGGLYLFKHGRGYCHFSGEKGGNIVTFAQEYMGAQDFKSAVEMILGCRAYEQTEHYVPPMEKKPRGDLVLPPKLNGIDWREDHRVAGGCLTAHSITMATFRAIDSFWWPSVLSAHMLPFCAYFCA